MSVIPYESSLPKISSDVFIAPNAWVIGQVEMAPQSSAFFGAVLRGDLKRILIGKGSNIQDNAVLHTTYNLHDLEIGEYVTIGHGAILHGCKVKDRCIIGMGSTILDDAVIGEDSLVGANALVTMNCVIPPRSLVVGSPAKVVRQLSEQELIGILDSAKRYMEKAAWYREYFNKNYLLTTKDV